MKLLHVASAALIAGGLIACQGISQTPASAANYADTILNNGKIYTVNENQPWAETVAIKSGNIIYVGDNSGAKAFIGPHTQQHDIAGKLVIPGMVDSHTHPGLVGMTTGLHVFDFPMDGPGRSSVTREAFLEALSKYAEENPDLPVIFAGFWPELVFGGDEGPNKAELDRIVPDRPVILMDDWGHSYWVNSKTLEVMEIDRNTPDPNPGYSYFQRDANGDPTGWILELTAFPTITKLTSAPHALTAIEQFLEYLSKQGVTTLLDAGNLGWEDKVYPLIAQLEKEGKLPLRYEGSAHIFLPEHTAKAIPELKRLRREYGGDRLKFNTIKIHFDGIGPLHTSAMLEPYNDAPEKSGATFMNTEELRDFILELHQERIDLMIHVVGDRAVRTALDAMEAAQKIVGGPLNTRLTLSHVTMINDADLPRFKKLGVVANLTPHWHNTSEEHAKAMASNIGDRAKKLMRAQPLLDDGVPVSFCSDILTTGSIPLSSPYVGMQMAHNRQSILGGKDAMVLPPFSERLSLEDMVKGYTLSGAYQLRMDDTLGSIEVGKKADLVVLSQNLFEMDRYDIYKNTPQAVLMEGEVINGQLP